MNFLFLIDPPQSLNLKKDTSLALMAAAQEKGHKVYYTVWGNFIYKEDKLNFKAKEIFVKLQEPYAWFNEGREIDILSDEIDVFFIRTDPPFDLNYLVHTWLLQYLPEKVVVINEPRGLALVNEKIFALRFSRFIPETVITRDKKIFFDFLKKHKKIVAKPIHGYGGSLVFLVGEEDLNQQVIFESLVQKSEYVILQKYIPEAQMGDKRILTLGDKILGCVLRLHSEKDHRNNFAAGGKALPCEITPKDREIVQAVIQEILPIGIHFAGIDILGEHLTEINVTSPTCLREMNLLYGTRLDYKVIEYAENLVFQKSGYGSIQTHKL